MVDHNATMLAWKVRRAGLGKNSPVLSCLPPPGSLNPRRAGEVAEWSNAAVLKTVERESVPRVRIPVSPPPTFRYSPDDDAPAISARVFGRLRVRLLGRDALAWRGLGAAKGTDTLTLQRRVGIRLAAPPRGLSAGDAVLPGAGVKLSLIQPLRNAESFGKRCRKG